MTNEKDFTQGWGAVDEEQGNGGGQKERPDFLKISIGDTKVRILDMIPHNYTEWYIRKANGGTGASIGYFGEADLMEKANKAHMSKIFKEADAKGLKDKARKDFLRDEGYKKQPYGQTKKKSIIHVLDRATGEVKLLDKGPAIFGAIKKLALNPEYGDPRQYDITISMSGDPSDFQSIEYAVTPARNNTELTEAEKALYEEKKIDLKKMKTPNYTPEQALMIANGATFADVLGTGSDSTEEVDKKADESNLPPADEKKPEDKPAEETKPAEEKKVDPPVEKGEELSPEELADMDFS